MTLLISLTPFVLAVSTVAFVVASFISFIAASAFVFTASFPAVFSSSVKPAWFPIVVFLASATRLISAIASAFLVVLGNVTSLMLVIPLFFAVFNAVSSWALSIFRIALSFAVFANPFTSVFSSLVRELSWSIWLVLFVNAIFTSFFAPSLFNTGVGALGIVTASLISDSTSFTVNVLP